MKRFTLLALLALGVVVVVVRFSVTESRFKCVGQLEHGDSGRQTTIFIKLSEYRLLVPLWSDSDGSLWLEVPNQFVRYYSHVENSGETRQIFYTPNELVGSFSKLSGALMLDTHAGFFEGNCERTGGD